MHLQENTIFYLFVVKVTQNVAQFPLHHVIYAPAKFAVATSNSLGRVAFTTNVTDRRTQAQTLLQLDTSWVLTVLEKVAKKA